MSDALKPRRWFRISLRTFFVLVTLFGVWLGVQLKWIKDRSEARRQCEVSSPQQMRADGIGIAYDPKALLSLRLFAEEPAFMVVRLRGCRYTLAELEKLFPESPEVDYDWRYPPGDY